MGVKVLPSTLNGNILSLVPANTYKYSSADESTISNGLLPAPSSTAVCVAVKAPAAEMANEEMVFAFALLE